MQEAVLKGILRNKEYSHAEVEMQLFENCNLRCVFCSQDHDAPLEQTRLSSLMRKKELAAEYVRYNDSSHFRFNLMGGELFQDSFEDGFFEDLMTMIGELDAAVKKYKKTAEYVFTTNLIFQKSARVQSFLEAVEQRFGSARLATSFDFVGRNWGGEQKVLFQKNVEHFLNRIHLVGVILHKPSIKKMLNDTDALFDWLYQRVPVVFEYYIPDMKRQDLFSPSDQDNLDAWKYLAKNYPNVEPINRWLSHGVNEVRCCSFNRMTILADDTISSCRYFPYEPKDFKSDLDKHSIAGMAMQFLEEQGCLSCSHFERCGLHCFVQADRRKRQKTEECFLNEFFAEYPCPQ